MSAVRNRALILSLFIFLPVFASGVENDHEPLEKVSNLSYAEIFDGALKNTYEFINSEARQQQATDFINVGDRWIAGRPSLRLSYLDDTGLGYLGVREFEYGIDLPLWRWGEREKSRLLGKSYQLEAQSWEAWLMLKVAGQVRDVLANIAEAEAMLNLERQATESAQELLVTTTTLFDSGELARLEVLQVEGLLLAQRKIELEAEAMLVDAEREYEVLTGLQGRPDYWYQEELSAQEEITAAHPQLQYLLDDVDLAEANIRQAESNVKGNPVLSLGGKRERSEVLQSYNDSFGIAISIPFGGKSLVSSRTSTARREKIEAEVLYKNTFRSLTQALHEVEHELFIISESLILTTQQSDLEQERWKMSETAFTQGELTLAPVILAFQAYQHSQKERERLLLKQQRLITEFNQIIGVLP